MATRAAAATVVRCSFKYLSIYQGRAGNLDPDLRHVCVVNTGLCASIHLARAWERCVFLLSALRRLDLTPLFTPRWVGYPKTETVAALQAFRKRNADAQRALDALRNQPTTVDIAKYRATLKNQSIVDEAERLLKNFTPVTYDVNELVKTIGAFETKAVSRHQRLNLFFFIYTFDVSESM